MTFRIAPDQSAQKRSLAHSCPQLPAQCRKRCQTVAYLDAAKTGRQLNIYTTLIGTVTAALNISTFIIHSTTDTDYRHRDETTGTTEGLKINKSFLETSCIGPVGGSVTTAATDVAIAAVAKVVVVPSLAKPLPKRLCKHIRIQKLPQLWP